MNKTVLQVNLNNGTTLYVQDITPNKWKYSPNLYTADNFYYDSLKEQYMAIETVIKDYPEAKIQFVNVYRKNNQEEWR